MNEEVLELQIRDNAGEAATALEGLARALGNLKDKIGNGLRLTGTVNALEKLKNAVTTGLTDESVARMERLANALEKVKSVGNVKLSGVKSAMNQLNMAEQIGSANAQAQSVSQAVDRGIETVKSRAKAEKDALLETKKASDDVKESLSGLQQVNQYMDTSKLDLMTQKYNDWKTAIAQGIDSGKLSGKQLDSQLIGLRNLGDEIERMKNESNDTNVGKTFDTLGEKVKETNGRFKQLLHDFGRIVKYRILRSVIKQITQAFVEGTKNVYFYSKAIGGDFAKAMDSAASSFLYLKNSLGAAFSPIIQSLIPALNQIIDVIVEVLNFINQIVSLISGKTTWTRALRTPVEAFEKTGKAAKDAGSSIKELLADWDELNIIQSESGSGRGATGDYAKDFASMFEEVELPQWMIEWKPLIEAILAGTLGAIVLPKIFNWIKKIFDLFGGDGANTLKNILNKLFGGDKFPTQPNYKPFPEMPKYGKFPVQPDYKPFPEMPDFGKAASEMTMFSAGAVAAAPAVNAIVEALGKLKTAFSLMDILKSLIPSIIGFLMNAFGGGNINIKVNREEYDNFKKDYDRFQEQNKDILFKFEVDRGDLEEVLMAIKRIDVWSKNNQTKEIKVKLVDVGDVLNTIREWVGKTDTKHINCMVDRESMEDTLMYIKRIDMWAKNDMAKNIHIQLIDNNQVLKETMDWIAREDTKIINIKGRYLTDDDGTTKTTRRVENVGNDDKPWYDWSFTEIINHLFGTNLPANPLHELFNSVTGFVTGGNGWNGAGRHEVELSGISGVESELKEILSDAEYKWENKDKVANPTDLGPVAPVGYNNAQMPPINYTDPNSDKTVNVEVPSMTGDVEAATKKANEEQNTILRTIEALARTISNKNWTINVTPNSGWGEHNSKSNAAYGRVTGDPLMMMNK